MDNLLIQTALNDILLACVQLGGHGLTCGGLENDASQPFSKPLEHPFASAFLKSQGRLRHQPRYPMIEALIHFLIQVGMFDSGKNSYVVAYLSGCSESTLDPNDFWN